jgi:hypothetical protein
MTPDELGRAMAVIDAATDDIVAGAIQGGWFENRESHSVDALLDLIRPETTAAARPQNMVHVVVDYEALMRGHRETGEKCEIPGIGPIPVTLARQMADDCILKVLLTKGVDVMTVAHAGYSPPVHLRTALAVRDQDRCIVPGCNRRRQVQIDHRNAYGRTRVTRLEDLALLCPFHHYLKTFCGYTYRGGPGTWEWLPPAGHDVDLVALRRVITTARRC